MKFEGGEEKENNMLEKSHFWSLNNIFATFIYIFKIMIIFEKLNAYFLKNEFKLFEI